MTNAPHSVFIMTHLVPTTETQMFYDVFEVPFDLDASRESSEFAAWFKEEVAPFGSAIHCGTHHVEEGIESRWILCLQCDWPDINQMEDVVVRPARGEIVVGTEELYHANANELTVLKGKVLPNLFYDDDGDTVGELDTATRERLARLGRRQLRQLGYNADTADAICARFLEAAFERESADWTWRYLQVRFERVARNYCNELGKAPPQWFVYERLAINRFTESGILDSALFIESIEALDDEEADRERQWLVQASSLLGVGSMANPETELLRPLDDGEVFSSHRGVVWFHQGELAWLGEFIADLLHHRHGEIVPRVPELAWVHVVAALIDRIQPRLPDHPVEDILDAIHEALDVRDPMALWIHELDELADVVSRALRASERAR